MLVVASFVRPAVGVTAGLCSVPVMLAIGAS
jgi:hypothetical protein